MALRYLARRIGIPALRQASRPSVSSSAGFGPFASRSSQAGNSNGDAGWKQESQDIMDRVARHKAEAAANDIMRAKRMKKIERRVYMGSAAITLYLAWCTIAAVRRELRLIMIERDLKRKARRLMELECGVKVEDTEGGENE